MLHACCAGRGLAAFPQPRYPTWISSCTLYGVMRYRLASFRANAPSSLPPSIIASFILAGIKKGTKAQSAGERRHLTLLSLHWHNTLPLLLSYLRSRSERNIRSGPFGKDGTVAICETMKSKTKEKVWTSSWDLMTKTDPSSMALFGTRSARHAVQPAFSFLVSMCKLYAACRSRCRRCALRQTPKS